MTEKGISRRSSAGLGSPATWAALWQDADRLIENIPSDFDLFKFNREFASDPARSQRLLLYGAYPNIRPELREELVKAAVEAVGKLQPEAPDAVQTEIQSGDEIRSGDIDVQPIPNNGTSAASNGLIQLAAAGAPSSGGKPGKLWQLEAGDEGYYSYEPKRNQYGHETTLNVIRDVGAKWAQTHPETPFGVGDISLEHGGTMKGHPSGHKMVLEVDIRLMRNDGKPAGTNWRNAEYSRALTQDLVNAFKSHPNVARIYFNDPKITGAEYLSNHDHHLHVVIKP
jgi:penicillin-insensitive murein DD-endopeptidase